jgi:arylsulfatase A-like enzyme
MVSGATPPARQVLLRMACLTTAAAYAYVLSEWLFFVTKPSVVSALAPAQAVAVLLIAPLALLAGAALVASLLLPAGLGLRVLGARRAAELLVVAVPALLITATIILLVENFTYTVLGFSVGSFTGLLRYAYGIGFAALFAWIALHSTRWLLSPRWHRGARFAAGAASAAVLVSFGVLGTSYRPAAPDLRFERASGSGQLPNVLILAGDGLESRRMSALGFGRRDTTPFIRTLLPEALVFENHFTNASNTTGSVASLLSGRLPTQTRVVFRPDVFRGIDAYRHLPAILRGLGYRSADISVRHHADAYDLNLRNGFDWANGRSLERPRAIAAALAVHPPTSVFVEQSYERISGRIRHAFGLTDLVNPYWAVTRRMGRVGDAGRVAQLLAFIDRTPEPFFAHVHLMVPHGKYFTPRVRYFSKGKRQRKPQMNVFYDDAIRDYDRSVRDVVEHLRRTGRYDRTLIVLNSDHGRYHASDLNLPLIIKLPKGARTGRVWFNTQRVDIAPTILDYLGVETPDWMTGESLIGRALDPMRPIIQAKRAPSTGAPGGRVVPRPRPPFYTMGAVGVVHCQWWYRLKLRRGTFSKGVVGDHTAPCARGLRPADADVRRFLVDHLRANGYAVSSLDRQRRLSR